MRRFFARFANLFQGRHAERELAREIDAHLTMLQDELEARGMSRDEARLAARRSYGNVEYAKDLHREARSFPWLENPIKDFRYGARNLLQAPAFTAVAVIALALGIGANTAIFSVVKTVLLQPLEYRDADRLVTVLHNGTGPVATANYLDWRDQSRSFETMGAADAWSPNVTAMDASDSRPAEHLRGLKVTQSLLPLLGVPPLIGRLFLQGEDQEGADHEVILSYALWQRRFHGDPGILGKLMKLDGEGYSVVGVMPATFKFAPFWAVHAELWAPNAFGATAYQRVGNHLRVFARLRTGVTLAQARADVASVTGRLEKQYPGTNRNVVVKPLKENVVGNIQTPLILILGAVGFVLLIACANVAHMLLARTADRQKEIAVRVALGAGKARLIAQFLTENLLLAGIGALAGLLLALAGTKALVTLSPSYIPRVEMVAIDSVVVIFLIGITIVTALCFGLTPALHAAAANLSDALKEGGRGDSDSLGRHRLRSFLVASEFALAFVLLIGAGLMVRSFYALQSVDPGFNPHNVLSMIVSVAGTEEAAPGRREIFYRELLEKIKAIPGVEAVGGINHLPLQGDLWDKGFEIEGRPKTRPGEMPNAVYRIVMPGYFETMRLQVKRGRTLTYQDNARGQAVVVINQRAAERFWPGENPIGKRIVIDGQNGGEPWLTIVGVTANASLDDMVSNPYPEMYLPALQTPAFLGEGTNPTTAHMNYITLVVRASGDPVPLMRVVQGVVRSFDRNLPISQVLTMEEAVAHATAQPRFEMLLLGLFALVALVLAAVGIYGVMNYSVSRRTREIGIRISLGASRLEVLRMVVVEGAGQALAGTVVGVAGAMYLSKLMVQMLYGVKPTDPLTFLGVTMVLGLTALLAAGVPARKAMQVDPMSALRTE